MYLHNDSNTGPQDLCPKPPCRKQPWFPTLCLSKSRQNPRAVKLNIQEDRIVGCLEQDIEFGTLAYAPVRARCIATRSRIPELLLTEPLTSELGYRPMEFGVGEVGASVTGVALIRLSAQNTSLSQA